MAICCVVRPPHHLGGVAKSRSLFVATPPLILRRCSVQPQVRLTPKDRLPDRQGKSAAGALQLPLFEQPKKDDFLSSLLDFGAIHFGIPLAINDLFGRGCES
jgi:hypothetical protein